MEFVLNHRLINLSHIAPHTTLLRFLREEEKLCGTKEGCASGDCGACTLMVGTVKNGVIEYQSMNSCITPLGAVQGKHVVTIEHLQQDDRLHPVQQAFVDFHASQCGFCTPGLIMSLTAYCAGEKKQNGIQREKICKAISGNLCRCTGYRPIIDAGIKASKASQADLYSEKVLNILRDIQQVDTSYAPEIKYFRPQNLRDWQHLRLLHPDAPMLAGGTDLVLDISTKYCDMPEIIDISNIEELLQFEKNQEQTTIGAALSYSSLEAKMEGIFPQFVSLLQKLGSPQIRNRGTVGGNIANASPVADTPPIFLALDASLNIINSAGNYRKIPLSDFYIDYKKTKLRQDEMIVCLSFPNSALNDFHRFYKISKRYDDDIASVMAAFRISLQPDDTINEARIAYGGMAATPIRLPLAENALKGKSIHDEKAMQEVIILLKKHLHPIGDVRASAEYRTSMAINLFRKAWLELGGKKLPSIHTEPLSNFGVTSA